MKPIISLGPIKLLLCVSVIASAQTCEHTAETHASFVNLGFLGAPGGAPPGWFLGPEWFMAPHIPIYDALIVPRAACNGSERCVTIRALRNDPKVPFCFLYQTVDAAKYRGKVMIYKASVRTEIDRARLLVRVRTATCRTSFRDDMGDFPITSPIWSSYAIRAPIASDAFEIEFGIQVFGNGVAWIDNVSVNFEAPAI